MQDFRPNTKVKADLSSFGAGAGEFVIAGEVPWRWREARVLAPARLVCDNAIIDLDDAGVRAGIETEYADLLSRYEMPHLDMSEISSKKRIVTQTIGRGLYDNGAAGVRFASNTDHQHCFVLFEGRGELEPADRDPDPLTDPIPELLQVCSEWDLVLRNSDLPMYVVQGRLGSRFAGGLSTES